MDLIEALNQAYRKQEARKAASALASKLALEQDIIDLTIDDSDEPSVQRTCILHFRDHVLINLQLQNPVLSPPRRRK